MPGRSPISTKQMAYDSIGPGTDGIHGDSPYYFITSAFLTMALVFLHTFWGIVFFDAYETRRYWKLALSFFVGREKENGHIMVYSELQLPMED